MKAEAYCNKCEKTVDVKELRFEEFQVDVYFKCGHHQHWLFAGTKSCALPTCTTF